jgi:hypothetical protein
MEQLLARRAKVRDLITAFKDSTRAPFPNWNKRVALAVPSHLHPAPAAGKFVM